MNVSDILRHQEEMQSAFPLLCSAGTEELFAVMAHLVTANEVEDILKSLQEPLPEYRFPRRASQPEKRRIGVVRNTNPPVKVYPVGRPPENEEENYEYVDTLKQAYQAAGRKFLG